MYFVHIVSAPTGHIIINYEAVVGCKVVRLTVSNGNGNPVAVMARMRWCFRELDVVVIEFGYLQTRIVPVHDGIPRMQLECRVNRAEWCACGQAPCQPHCVLRTGQNR